MNAPDTAGNAALYALGILWTLILASVIIVAIASTRFARDNRDAATEAEHRAEVEALARCAAGARRHARR